MTLPTTVNRTPAAAPFTRELARARAVLFLRMLRVVRVARRAGSELVGVVELEVEDPVGGGCALIVPSASW